MAKLKEDWADPTSTGRRKNFRVWAVLGIILLLYVFSALRTHPVSAFGSHADDALYFASAKSLAAGGGYYLPSFPVRLRATKYPELYPLLLAGVWKIDPHFPDNVALAASMTLTFGCLALIFAFLLLRRWPGLGDWPALAIVGLCAFNILFLDLSASVMTGIPFMAVMLGAVWLAECEDRKRWSAVGAGLLAGVSVGVRSLGVATVAGIWLVLLARRDFRRLLWFSLAAAPISLLSFWPALSAILHPAETQMAAAAAGQAGSGWAQTVCYYSSYACSWKMNVNGPATLGAVVLTNLKLLVEAPGLYLLSPLRAQGGMWTFVLMTLASFGSYAGIVRYLRRAGWKPLPVVFAFYLMAVLPWPYPLRRFLLLFLPLFFGGLWIEGRRLTALVAEHVRPSHASGERLTAGLLAAGALALAATVAVNYTYAMPVEMAHKVAEHKKIVAAQRGAYEWIRQHAPAGTRVIAYEDALLYLYTGHQAVVPIAWTTQDIYDGRSRFARRDAAHLTDVARHIGARYWLATPWDFQLDGPEYPMLLSREKHLLDAAPVVYQDAEGKVRLYNVQCLDPASGKNCSGKTTATKSRASAARIERSGG